MKSLFSTVFLERYIERDDMDDIPLTPRACVCGPRCPVVLVVPVHKDKS